MGNDSASALSGQVDQSEMMQAALEYAARGWFIFPIMAGHKGEKAEDGSGTHHLRRGHLDASNDPETVCAWWTDWPDANIGLHLAASGLVAVDADTYKPDCAFEAIRSERDLPGTLIQRSARGGTHYIFRSEPDARYPRELGSGVDVKHRGYILLEPSTFAGGVYRWANNAAIAPAPAWLPKPERGVAEMMGNAHADDGTTLAEVEEALRYIPADCSYGDWLEILQALHHGFGCDALPLADEWSRTAPHLYQEGLVDQKFASFRASGDGPQVTLATLFKRAKTNGADLAAIHSKHFNPDNWFGANAEAEGAEAPGSASAPSQRRRALRLMPFAEAAAKALEASAEPLVEDLLDRGALSTVYGPSNSGKTFVVLDMAFAIACGRPWAGRETTRSGVLYLALEGGSGIRKRFEALRREYPDADPRGLMLATDSLDLFGTPDDAQAVIDAANSIPGGCGLIVVDTLARAMAGGNEDTAANMGKLVRNVDAIRTATGAHVLLIHHSGKDTARGARGSSALRAAVDTELMIADGTISNPKQRDHEMAKDLSFTLPPVQIGEDVRGRPVTAAVVRFGNQEPQPVATLSEAEQNALDALCHIVGGTGAGAYATQGQVAARLGKQVDTARKQLDALAKKGFASKPHSGRYAPTAMGLLRSAPGTESDASPEQPRGAEVHPFPRKTGKIGFSSTRSEHDIRSDTTGKPTGTDIFG